jgi:alpha-glutamyl/putrescinyl thymine pyrophosphorylase clade 1
MADRTVSLFPARDQVGTMCGSSGALTSGAAVGVSGSDVPAVERARIGGWSRPATRRRPPVTTRVFDTYWHFAAERQRIYHRRVRGEPGPWTDDPVLSTHRFTNAYRASDRVSQYLIRQVAYDGDQAVEEVVFRVLLFKLFNKVSTWQLIRAELGAPTAGTFSVEAYDAVLTRAFTRGARLYSAAYIMPAAAPGVARKHLTHLQLMRRMLDERLPERLATCTSMRAGYEALLSYRGIGPFLAYQLIADLNYTRVVNFSEMEFVVPGPGARSGIRKCFADYGDHDEADLIRYVAERQEHEFATRAIAFENLWGRPLQLIDCQNLFCEVDKYARVVHPDVQGMGGRSRIKQRFRASPEPVEAWFPPKWGINDRLTAERLKRPDRSIGYAGRQPALPLVVP